jgi:hypothetical protein
MIFARCVDMFWLIEPNFKDAAGNLHWRQLAFSLTSRFRSLCCRCGPAYYLTQLMQASAGERERSAPRRDAGA